jgi:hypothetical protein
VIERHLMLFWGLEARLFGFYTALRADGNVLRTEVFRIGLDQCFNGRAANCEEFHRPHTLRSEISVVRDGMEQRPATFVPATALFPGRQYYLHWAAGPLNLFYPGVSRA